MPTMTARTAPSGTERHDMRPNGKPERWLVAARLSRVTRKDRDRGDDVLNGIYAQDHGMTRWARAEGHEIVAITKDPNVSGRIHPAKRPGIGPWLTDPELLVHYDGIAASAVDRLSRKTFDAAWLRDWAERNGKKLYVARERLYWPDEHNGVAWAVAIEMAAAELKLITDRIANSRETLTDGGKLVGRPPFGYTVGGERYDKALVPTDDGRTYVPLIFGKIIEGESQGMIAEWLRAEGVKPHPDAAGPEWWTRTIGLLIKNPVYMGHRCMRAFAPPDEVEADDGIPIRYRYGDNWVLYPRWEYGKTIHRCEPLVDAATWRAANETLSGVRPKRSRYAPENRAMLTSALRCAECGGDSPMYRHHAASPRKGRARVPMFYYRCRPRGQRASCGFALRLELVDDAVNAMMRNDAGRRITEKRVTRGNGAEIEQRLKTIGFELEQLGKQGLPWDQEDAKRAELRADYQRAAATPLVEDRVERVKIAETYLQRWERTPVNERGAWLVEHGFKVYASRGQVRLVLHDGEIAEVWSTFDLAPSCGTDVVSGLARQLARKVQP